MARRKPAWLQKREYDAAVAREEYYRTRQPNTSTTVNKRQMSSAIYTSLLFKTGTSHNQYIVPISVKSREFFGGATEETALTALGLSAATGASGIIPRKPKGFDPSRVYAMVSDGTPTAKTTPWNTRTINYAGATSGTSQSHFSAPVGPVGTGQDATPSLAELNTRVEAIYAAKKTALDAGQGYSRFWFTPEQASIIQM